MYFQLLEQPPSLETGLQTHTGQSLQAVRKVAAAVRSLPIQGAKIQIRLWPKGATLYMNEEQDATGMVLEYHNQNII